MKKSLIIKQAYPTIKNLYERDFGIDIIPQISETTDTDNCFKLIEKENKLAFLQCDKLYAGKLLLNKDKQSIKNISANNPCFLILLLFMKSENILKSFELGQKLNIKCGNMSHAIDFSKGAKENADIPKTWLEDRVGNWYFCFFGWSLSVSLQEDLPNGGYYCTQLLINFHENNMTANIRRWYSAPDNKFKITPDMFKKTTLN